MLTALPVILAQSAGQESSVVLPSYFLPVFFVLMIAGALASLVAAVVGFGRAKTAGPHARWFALAAACLFVFHLQLIAMGFASIKGNAAVAFPLVTAMNLFILLAAICLVIGFRHVKQTVLQDEPIVVPPPAAAQPTPANVGLRQQSQSPTAGSDS